jgi:hypothetical protein
MSKEFLNKMTKKELLEWAKVAYDEIQEYIEYCLKLKEEEEFVQTGNGTVAQRLGELEEEE